MGFFYLKNAIAIYLLIFVIILILSVVTYVFHDFLKKQWLKIWGKICAYSREFWFRFKLLLRISKVLKNSYYSHSMDITFEMFCHFYEEHFDKNEDWILDTEVFPEGKLELTNMYKWIKKTRKENYIEAEKLEFDNNHFKYWGTSYEELKYSIRNSVLKIHPLEKSDKPNLELQFRRKKLKIMNDLYNLDTEKAHWILERRRHLRI